MNTQFTTIIESLEFLKEDPVAIKRVKAKADELIVLLQQSSAINLDKALRELEDLGTSEIPSYDRTLLWDIISMLESVSVITK